MIRPRSDSPSSSTRVPTVAVALALGACGADPTSGAERHVEEATLESEGEVAGSCLCQADLEAPPAEASSTFWVRGRDLFPAWGYHLDEGGPRRYAEDGVAPLTWVANLPPHVAGAERRLFVRLVKAHGDPVCVDPYPSWRGASVVVDDVTMTPPESQPAEGAWTLLGDGWHEIGTIPADIGAGPHHIEVAPPPSQSLAGVMITSTPGPGLPPGFLGVDPPPVPPPECSLTDAGLASTKPIANPVTRFPRHHRRSFPPRAAGGPPTDRWELGTAERFDEDFTNWHSFDGAPLLSAEGARNQTVAVGFSMAFRAVKGVEEQVVQISPTDLVSGDGTRIPASQIDVRVALVRNDVSAHYETVVPRPVARLLVKNDIQCPLGEGGWPSFELCTNERRGAVRPMGLQGAGTLVCKSGICAPPPATTLLRDGDERQFWVTIDTAGLFATGTETPPPAGLYHGSIRLTTDDGSGDQWDVPLEVQLHDFTLDDAPGKNGVIYAKCVDDGLPFSACTEHFASPDEVHRDRRDQRAHGLDAFESRNAFVGLELAEDGGFDAPHLRNAMISADVNGDVRDPNATCTLASCPTIPYADRLDRVTREGWNITRFLCDEPAPPGIVFHGSPPGCAAPYGPGPVTSDAVLAALAEVGRGEAEAGRRTAITLNDPATVDALVPFFGDAIVAITTNGLWDRLHLLAGRDAASPCNEGPGGAAPRQHLAYWDAAPTYPILHRALAGRFVRTMYFRHKYCSSGPVFDGIFVNSYDQGWQSGFTYPDENDAPIPTARWEALREGLDDARYHEALSARMERAEKQLANTPETDPRYVGLHRALEVAKLALGQHDVQASRYRFRYFDFLGAGVAARPWSRGEMLPLDQMRHDYAVAVVMLDRELAGF